MHKVRGNYSNCTSRSSKNICSSSGCAQENGNRGSDQDETQFGTKSGAFLRFFFFWGTNEKNSLLRETRTANPQTGRSTTTRSEP
jgi:hypothetical protein